MCTVSRVTVVANFSFWERRGVKKNTAHHHGQERRAAELLHHYYTCFSHSFPFCRLILLFTEAIWEKKEESENEGLYNSVEKFNEEQMTGWGQFWKSTYNKQIKNEVESSD